MFQAILGFFTRSKPHQTQEMNDSLWGWAKERLKWSPTSLEALKGAEQNIFSYVKSAISLSSVNILHNGEECEIRTLSVNGNDEAMRKRVPLVLLHGLGSGIGLWVLNLDSFAKKRPVYAADILGFGLSSRPSFVGGAEEVEAQLVESIEQWRQKMHLEKFVLLGHSMGGFLASSYAIKYPDNVCHLILADPWGFPERDKTVALRVQIPFWVKAIGSVLQYFNPFSGLRAAGPWGPQVLKKIRPDLLLKFSLVVDDPDVVSDYIFHCNAQHPSGETAFKTMAEGIGWAKCPMMSRISNNLREDVPITFIYGSRSWIDCQSGYNVKSMRKYSYVDVTLVPSAGHHVYADQPDLFHSIVQQVCDRVDEEPSIEYNSQSAKQATISSDHESQKSHLFELGTYS